MPDQTTTRPLYVIARDVRANWPEVNFGAVPYLEAMERLDKLTDRYGEDDGETAVRYFLSNTRTWSGPEAHRIKNELRAMVGLPLAKAPKPSTAKPKATDAERAERKANAALLRAAVSRTMFCPYTDILLDMRRAVLITTPTRSICVAATKWDEVRDEFFAQLNADQAAQVKVYDGRELFTPAGRVR